MRVGASDTIVSNLPSQFFHCPIAAAIRLVLRLRVLLVQKHDIQPGLREIVREQADA